MKLATLSAALLATTACATDPSTEGPQGPQPEPGDTVAPSVVSTTPTASAKGVGADARIEITFSEPMDPATVESAYSSQKLPLDKVSMEWNAEQTVLTISPDADLSYGDGTGNDPATANRISYALTIGTGATDLAGNPMAAPLELAFSTKVRMFTTAHLISSLSRTTLGGTALADSANVIAGDASLNNLPYKGYLTFDLAALPQGISIESATFAARQLSVDGTPYGSFGALQAYHLTFSAMDEVFALQPLSAPGAFSMNGASESKSIDVTSQVADDVANRVARGDHSQYRLAFDGVSANNAYDRATFAKDTFEMSLVYVAD